MGDLQLQNLEDCRDRAPDRASEQGDGGRSTQLADPHCVAKESCMRGGLRAFLLKLPQKSRKTPAVRFEHGAGNALSA